MANLPSDLGSGKNNEITTPQLLDRLGIKTASSTPTGGGANSGVVETAVSSISSSEPSHVQGLLTAVEGHQISAKAVTGQQLRELSAPEQEKIAYLGAHEDDKPKANTVEEDDPDDEDQSGNRKPVPFDDTAVGLGIGAMVRNWFHRHHFVRKAFHHIKKTLGKIKERVKKAGKGIKESLFGEGEKTAAKDGAEVLGKDGAEALSKDAAEVLGKDGAKSALKTGAELIGERAGMRIGARLVGAAGAATLGAAGITTAVVGGVGGFLLSMTASTLVGAYAVETGFNYFLGGKEMTLGQAATKTASDWKTGITKGIELLREGKTKQVARDTLEFTTGIPDLVDAVEAGNMHKAAQIVAPVTTTAADVTKFAVQHPRDAQEIGQAAQDVAGDKGFVNGVADLMQKLGRRVASGESKGTVERAALQELTGNHMLSKGMEIAERAKKDAPDVDFSSMIVKSRPGTLSAITPPPRGTTPGADASPTLDNDT